MIQMEVGNSDLILKPAVVHRLAVEARGGRRRRPHRGRAVLRVRDVASSRGPPILRHVRRYGIAGIEERRSAERRLLRSIVPRDVGLLREPGARGGPDVCHICCP